MNELVSVIVPCYNVEGTLERCLASIAAQTHENIEVLCVNDGSTDSTLAVAEAFAAADERFRVIDKPNGGYGAACNRALDEAQGAWVAVVEPDDTIRPQMFEKMLAFAEKVGAKGPVDVVKTPYWTVLPGDGATDGATIPCRYYGRVRVKQQPFVIEMGARLMKHRPSIWSALYRTEFLRSNGIRFVEAPGAGWTDNPFLYDTLLRARGIAYLNEAFYEYREEAPEKTEAFAKNHPDQVIARLNEMADIVDELNVVDADVLGAHAKRTVNYLRILADAHGLGDGKEPAETYVEATGIDAPWSAAKTYHAMQDVARRLDPAIVFAEPELPTRNKRLFAALTGEPMPRISPLPRLKTHTEEALWLLRTRAQRGGSRAGSRSGQA